jgi:hypothetical protein
MSEVSISVPPAAIDPGASPPDTVITGRKQHLVKQQIARLQNLINIRAAGNLSKESKRATVFNSVL